MSIKKEATEIVTVGTVGVSGLVLPQAMDIETTFEIATLIVSFFFIVCPTAVWACIRTYKAIKHINDKEDDS